MTIFPTWAFSAMQRKASRACENGKRRQMTGSTPRAAIARNMSWKFSRCPQVTPCNRTCRMTASGRFIEALAAREDADQRYRSARPDQPQRGVQCFRAADLDDQIDSAAGQFPHLTRPIGFAAVIDDRVGAEFGEFGGLGLARGGRDDARAQHLGELQREQRDAAGPLRDDDRSGRNAALSDHRRPCRQRGARQSRCELGRNPGGRQPTPARKSRSSAAAPRRRPDRPARSRVCSCRVRRKSSRERSG